MSRRFEFVQGASAKFWEISVTGREVTVRYGRIGTAGQSLTKAFDHVNAAQRHVDRQVTEKLAKGYVEGTAAVN